MDNEMLFEVTYFTEEENGDFVAHTWSCRCALSQLWPKFQVDVFPKIFRLDKAFITDVRTL